LSPSCRRQRASSASKHPRQLEQLPIEILSANAAPSEQRLREAAQISASSRGPTGHAARLACSWRERDAASTRWLAQSSPQRWPICARSTAAEPEHQPAVRTALALLAARSSSSRGRVAQQLITGCGAHAARGNRRRAVLVRVLPACGRQPAARASRQRSARAPSQQQRQMQAAGPAPAPHPPPSAGSPLSHRAPRPSLHNHASSPHSRSQLAARKAPTHVSASCSSASLAEPPPHLSVSSVSHSQLAPPAPYQRAPPPPRESPTAASPRARRSLPSMRCVLATPLASFTSSSSHAAQLAQAPHRDGHDEAVRARVCGALVKRCPLTSLCAQPHVRPRSHARQRFDAGVLCALPRARGE
jgi:hypothetical protein